MRRFLIPCLGFGLLVGCQNANERAAEHQKNAQEKMEQSKDENAQAQAEREKALNDNQRQPVAGRDPAMMEHDLHDQLGDDWRIEHMGTDGLVAIRTKMKRPDDKLMSKVNDEIKTVRDHDKGLMVSHRGSEVMLRGTVDDCKSAAQDADKFAKIDGINRIVVDVTCPMK